MTDPHVPGLGVLCEVATGLAGVDGAAVSAMMSAQSRQLIHATDALAERIDDMQFVVGEGPCLEAYSSQWPLLCPDLDAAEPRRRWSAFSAEVMGLGVDAVFAFPIPGALPSLGVLELYRRATGTMSDEQIDRTSQCAQAIGRVMIAAQSQTGCLTEVSEVSVAAVIVGVQLGVSPEEALARMRAHAYASDVPITSAAADIVTGRLSLQR